MFAACFSSEGGGGALGGALTGPLFVWLPLTMLLTAPVDFIGPLGVTLTGFGVTLTGVGSVVFPPLVNFGAAPFSFMNRVSFFSRVDMLDVGPFEVTGTLDAGALEGGWLDSGTLEISVLVLKFCGFCAGAPPLEAFAGALLAYTVLPPYDCRFCITSVAVLPVAIVPFTATVFLFPSVPVA